MPMMSQPLINHRNWRLLLSLILLTCFQFTLGKEGDYLYYDLPNGQNADPILEYTKDHSDPEQYPDFMDKSIPDHRVVVFYSPQCPHCIHFAPDYIQFARNFHNLTQQSDTLYAGLDVQFWAVSCMKYKKVCRKEKANSYPTLKVYAGSQPRPTAKFIHQSELHPLTLVKALGHGMIKDQGGEEETNLMVKNGNAQSSYYMPRSQAQIYGDAYLTFYNAMKDSVFLEDGPLPQVRGQAIKQWLNMMKKVLPPWRLNWMVAELLEDFKENAATEKQWTSVVETYPPQQTEWSAGCQQHESPYTCGLWTLFHIVTVGVVEYNRAIPVARGTLKHRAQKTASIAIFLREYVHHFFLCEECSTHFVQAFDKGEYNREARLQQSEFTLEEWRELPLWLLDFHNGVNVRLQRERFEREDRTEPATLEEQQSVLWPAVEDCPICWTHVEGDKSVYDPTVMYNYMRMIYWPEDGATLTFQRQLKASIEEYKRNPNKIMQQHASRRAEETKQGTFDATMPMMSLDSPYLLYIVAVCGIWIAVLWRKIQLTLQIQRAKLSPKRTN